MFLCASSTVLESKKNTPVKMNRIVIVRSGKIVDECMIPAFKDDMYPITLSLDLKEGDDIRVDYQ